MRRRAVLTEAQVAALPDGAAIRVIWSGGNGPHTYRLQRDEWGRLGVEGPGTYWQPLEGVGVAPGTQVWRVERAEAP